MKDPYENLRQQLADGFTWPTVYMFKFIIPADNQKIALVENLFNTTEAQVTMRESKNGSFVSITAREMMMSPEKVIDRYRQASEIEGLIAL